MSSIRFTAKIFLIFLGPRALKRYKFKIKSSMDLIKINIEITPDTDHQSSIIRFNIL